MLSTTFAVAEQDFSNVNEQKLLKAYDKIVGQQSGDALEKLQQLTDHEQNYRLAHLLEADIWLRRAGKNIGVSIEEAAFDARLAPSELLQELDARLQWNGTVPADIRPAEILHLDPVHKYVLVADLARSRLLVFEQEQGEMHFVVSYYLTIGRAGPGKDIEDDLKTPLGVYHFLKYIPDEELPDLYGAGALTMNYPNAWDRFTDKTGHGIWLHGTESGTYSRPPLASEGCLVVTNDDFKRLLTLLNGEEAPIIVGTAIDWVRGNRIEDGSGFKRVFNSWRSKLASREQVSDYYSALFENGRFDKQTWLNGLGYRYGVENTDLKDISAIKSPDSDTVVVSFKVGDNGKHIRQYWFKEHNQWRIFFEGQLSTDQVNPMLAALENMLSKGYTSEVVGTNTITAGVLAP